MKPMMILLVVAAMAAAAGALLPGAIDTSGTTTEHCVVEVLGQMDTGQLLTAEPWCVSGEEARADLYRSTGIRAESAAVLLANSGADPHVTELATAAVSVLGVHYDGANLTGSSLAVYGNNCTGGYINLPSSWVNRVSSSDNVMCSRIKHHDRYNTRGSYQSSWGSGGNLSYMSNRANSISYTRR